MSWKPIETAPKDGGDVLLAVYNKRGEPESPALAYWTDKNPEYDYYQDGWYESTFSDNTVRVKYEPRYWQPIPEPPTD